MTEQLKPCPFCGSAEPVFERVGTSRQSCIVVCGNCGARHESCDEGEDSGASWNRRAQPAQAVPVLTESELRSILQGTNHMVKNAMHGAFWPELEEACRAIEQAVRAKLGVAQWLPIETAPKDGSVFLCWVTAERYGETDEGQQYSQDASQADFGWWRPGDEAGYFDCGCGQIGDRQHISHWMPLPPPPGIVGKEGA